jgi:ABC-type transporter Mla subunit MlaD
MRGSAVQVRLVALLASQPHLQPNSRIVGYATVAVVTVVLLLLGWRLYTYTHLSRDQIWVHFTGNGDLIGSLQDDDPVAIQGVNVGQVEKILSDTTGVMVRLRFWKHQTIYRDARAMNFGNGLMGMRYVLLERGFDSTHPLDRAASIEGTFNPGIAEVMSGIQEVVDRVREIHLAIDTMAQGGGDHAPFHRMLLDKLEATDALLGKFDRISAQLPHLARSTREGGRLARGLADSLHGLEPGAFEILADCDSALRQVRKTLLDSRVLVRRTDTLVHAGFAPLEPFTRDDSLLRKIERTLTVVDLLENFTGGRSKVKTNIHFWGSNPSKHGE